MISYVISVLAFQIMYNYKTWSKQEFVTALQIMYNTLILKNSYILFVSALQIM